jgi:hypothetical protein
MSHKQKYLFLPHFTAYLKYIRNFLTCWHIQASNMPDAISDFGRYAVCYGPKILVDRMPTCMVRGPYLGGG